MKQYNLDKSYKGKSYKNNFDDDNYILVDLWLNISKKIDGIITKIALLELRQIIINEMKKGYYENAANIKEIVDINTYLIKKDSSSLDYLHVENIVYWQNGFYSFNNFTFTSTAILKEKNVDNKDILRKHLYKYKSIK